MVTQCILNYLYITVHPKVVHHPWYYLASDNIMTSQMVNHILNRLTDCLQKTSSVIPVLDEYRSLASNGAVLQDVLIQATFTHLTLVPILHQNGVRYPEDFLETHPNVFRKMYTDYYTTNNHMAHERSQVVSILLQSSAQSADLSSIINEELCVFICKTALKWHDGVVHATDEDRHTYFEDILHSLQLFITANPTLTRTSERIVRRSLEVIHNNYHNYYFSGIPCPSELRHFVGMIHFLVVQHGFPIQCRTKFASGNCLFPILFNVVKRNVWQKCPVHKDCIPLVLDLFQAFLNHGCDPGPVHYDALLRYEIFKNSRVTYLEFLIPLFTRMWQAGLGLGCRESGLHQALLKYNISYIAQPSVLHITAVVTYLTDLQEEITEVGKEFNTELHFMITNCLGQFSRDQNYTDECVQSARIYAKFLMYLLVQLKVRQRQEILQWWTSEERAPLSEKSLKYKEDIQTFSSDIDTLRSTPDSLKFTSAKIIRNYLMKKSNIKRTQKTYHYQAVSFCSGSLKLGGEKELSDYLNDVGESTGNETASGNNLPKSNREKLRPFYETGLLRCDFLTGECGELGVPKTIVYYITGLDLLEQVIIDIWQL